MTPYEEQIRLKKVLEERKKREQEQKDRFELALQQVLRTHEGKVVFKHLLLNVLKVDADTYSSNPLIMAQQCGLRTGALEIKSQIVQVCGINAYRAIEDEVI